MLLTVAAVLAFTLVSTAHAQLGTAQKQVPWRAAHAAAFVDPYVIVYGGVDDPNLSNTGPLNGSSDVWVWDSRNGSWFHPTMVVQAGTSLLPQVFARAITLTSSGEMLALASNTSQGGAAGMLQKLDTNGWSWTFPTSSVSPPARAIGSAVTRVNNTIFTYGGVSVDANGTPITNALLNSLSSLDANAFTWTPESNGMGVTEHAMCYIAACNCIISFGGTSTGSPAGATNNLYVYNLTSRTWNLQVTAGTVNGAAPGARRLHTANCLQDRMIIYGGGTNQPFDQDVWSLSVADYPTMTWERLSIANASQSPSQRMGHSAVLDEKNNKMYVFGGWGVTATNDSNMYVLDTLTWGWTRVSPAGFSTPTLPGQTPGSMLPNDSDGLPSNKVAVIVGAAVGGAVGIALAIAGLCVFWRHYKRKEDGTGKEGVWDKNTGYEDDNDRPSQRRSLSGATIMTPGNKRGSKAWTGSVSRQSQLGDFDTVATKGLEPLLSHDDPSTAAVTPHTRNSSQGSFPFYRDASPRGQVPNEIERQYKPNEPSYMVVPRRATTNLPMEHHQSPFTLSVPSSPLSSSLPITSAPWSSSMEVLRSITTASQPLSIPVTHASASSVPGEDDKWTQLDMSSKISRASAPIHYIHSGSHGFSIATTATASDGESEQISRRPVTLTHHHSSSSKSDDSTPLAQSVVPSLYPASEPVRQSTTSIYDALSPLDMLATLSRTHQGSSFVGDAPPDLKHDTPQQAIENTAPNTSHVDDVRQTVKEKRHSLLSVMDMLPQRYKPDMSQPPFVGPWNAVLFVYGESQKPAAIKVFKRREAWERECRTLIKLKSLFAVDLLEVLTIQAEEDMHDAAASNAEEEEAVKYVTVMERMDETLSSVLRQARSGSISWTPRESCQAAKEITSCLAWCHTKDVAFCDLKPSNVMRMINQPWKLIDFEASRTVGQECVDVITPRYCPPEVARATTYGLEGANGVVATASVDLWALGCMIYELETQTSLFPSDVNDETVLHFVSHPSPSTPALLNGLRWTEDKELCIPHFEKRITNEYARQLIQTLLRRDATRRGTASLTLEHAYFK